MSPATRRRVSVACIIAGTIALLVGLPFAYLDRNVFEARGFAGNVAASLQDDAVREQVTNDISDALVSADPQAVSFLPVIRTVVDSLLASERSAAIVRAAAVETHNAVFSQSEGSVVIDLANLGIVALEFLGTQNPGLAAQLSRPREIALKVADRSLTSDAIERADRVRTLAAILPPLAVLLFGTALLIVPNRRRAALDVGTAIFVTGVLLFAAYLIVGGVLLLGSEGLERDVISGIWDAFTRDFMLWCALLASAGGIVAAAAASVIGELDPARLPQLLWGRITREPDATWKLVLGAVALILVGAAIIADPLGAVRLGAGVFGAWLVFAGTVTLLRLLIGPDVDLPLDVSARKLRRRLLPAVLAGLAIVGGGALLFGLVLDSRARPDPVVSASTGCNGFDELCDRPLSDVTLPATHNSESSAQALFLNPNHGIDIRSQLELGVRGLLIDAYLGQRNEQGTVRTDLAPKAVEAAEAQIGPEGLAAAQRLAGSVAFGPIAGGKQLYLCHVLCELGAVEADDAFREIRDWMELNPRELLVIIIEDAAPTADIKRELEQSGLAELASDEPIEAGEPAPTLRTLIDSGRRLIVAAEEKGDPSGWYRRAFELFQETPYGFTTTSELGREGSCAANRGGLGRPLFLVNHWVEAYPPRPRDASVVNERGFITRRARRCEAARDATPTLIAVDFVERGDLIGAVDELNGLSRTASGAPAAP